MKTNAEINAEVRQQIEAEKTLRKLKQKPKTINLYFSRLNILNDKINLLTNH